MKSFKVCLDNGSNYITSMAAGVTLAMAKDYFIGQIQYLNIEETKSAKVINVIEVI